MQGSNTGKPSSLRCEPPATESKSDDAMLGESEVEPLATRDAIRGNTPVEETRPVRSLGNGTPLPRLRRETLRGIWLRQRWRDATNDGRASAIYENAGPQQSRARPRGARWGLSHRVPETRSSGLGLGGVCGGGEPTSKRLGLGQGAGKPGLCICEGPAYAAFWRRASTRRGAGSDGSIAELLRGAARGPHGPLRRVCFGVCFGG